MFSPVRIFSRRLKKNIESKFLPISLMEVEDIITDIYERWVMNNRNKEKKKWFLYNIGEISNISINNYAHIHAVF